jgi:hypothetical protein
MALCRRNRYRVTPHISMLFGQLVASLFCLMHAAGPVPVLSPSHSGKDSDHPCLCTLLFVLVKNITYPSDVM